LEFIIHVKTAQSINYLPQVYEDAQRENYVHDNKKITTMVVIPPICISNASSSTLEEHFQRFLLDTQEFSLTD